MRSNTLYVSYTEFEKIISFSLCETTLSYFKIFCSNISLTFKSIIFSKFLYVVSILFGLSQGGIVPSYALIVKKYLPNKDAAERIGLIIFFTIIGMSIGGWMSGKIYDYTNSYSLGFLNSILWNLTNVMIILYIFMSFKKSKVVI